MARPERERSFADKLNATTESTKKLVEHYTTALKNTDSQSSKEAIAQKGSVYSPPSRRK